MKVEVSEFSFCWHWKCIYSKNCIHLLILLTYMFGKLIVPVEFHRFHVMYIVHAYLFYVYAMMSVGGRDTYKHKEQIASSQVSATSVGSLLLVYHISISPYIHVNTT